MTGFGRIEKKEDAFEYYKEKYVVIYTNNRSFGGMLKEIEDGWLILQPFQGYEYDAEKGLTRKLVKDEIMKVRRDDATGIEPTTEKDIIAYCEYSNKHPESEQKKKDESK